MYLQLLVPLKYSLGIAALIGIWRFRKISVVFLPFLLFLWLGFANEIVSEVTARVWRNTTLNNNIYVLLEACLILWQFQKWGLFQRQKAFVPVLLLSFVTFWCVEIFVNYHYLYVASYFRIFYSFVIVLMSIHMINFIIVSESRSLLKNPIFLICIGFIIFFTYKILIEIFWVYGLNGSRDFRNNVYMIHSLINFFSNIIYALAALWVPRKQIFLMPS
jgi:hypothetical protein